MCSGSLSLSLSHTLTHTCSGDQAESHNGLKQIPEGFIPLFLFQDPVWHIVAFNSEFRSCGKTRQQLSTAALQDEMVWAN